MICDVTHRIDCRIARSSYVRSSKKIEFWEFFGVFVSVFFHFVVQFSWMIADD